MMRLASWRGGHRDEGGTARRFTVPKASGRARVNLPPTHPALVQGRTIFPSRVVASSDAPRILVEGVNAAKIGKSIDVGRWKGMPVYTLTLEERATCPRTCKEWATCYGSNMHMARRVRADDGFIAKLDDELFCLNYSHPKGFVVRLHILGDFYSVAYAEFWGWALDQYEALRVFGYSARHPEYDGIGVTLRTLAGNHWDRFALRFSGNHGHKGAVGTEVVVDPREASPGAIMCPAQTGATDRCGTCGLCWQSTRPIAFLRH